MDLDQKSKKSLDYFAAQMTSVSKSGIIMVIILLAHRLDRLYRLVMWDLKHNLLRLVQQIQLM